MHITKKHILPVVLLLVITMLLGFIMYNIGYKDGLCDDQAWGSNER